MNSLLKLLLIIPITSFSQIPLIENFDQSSSLWTFTGSAGFRTYGGDSYATTGPPVIPYPNNSNVTMNSPVLNLNTGCASGTTDVWIYFPLFGIIEPNVDFFVLQYRVGAGPWITIASYTGDQNATYSYINIPNTATRFRFQLQASPTVNTYLVGGVTTPYRYDISRFSINCLVALPVEILSFTVEELSNENIIEWKVEDETISDYYLIEKRTNSGEWKELATVNCEGLSSYQVIDKYPEDIINYYKLTQVDINGVNHIYNEDLVSIDNRFEDKTVSQIINLLGQPCNINESGIVIIQYTDGSIEKKFNP